MDYQDIRDQVLSGVIMAFWVMARPFVWIYKLLRWFILAVTKETGNRIVKIVAGLIAVAIVGYVYQLIFHHPLK